MAIDQQVSISAIIDHAFITSVATMSDDGA